MKQLKDCIVLITGASSGIGQACAVHFARAGAHLILAARRLERLQKLKISLEQKYAVKVLPIELNVCDKTAVESCLSGLAVEWQAIDYVINNAGLALTTDKLQHGKPADWDTMIDTNIKGLLYVTRAVVPGMIVRQSGHIINIGSIAGSAAYGGGNVYCATKHAVQAISDVLRIDLLGSHVRVTNVKPGMVQTEFSKVRWGDQKKSDAFYAGTKPLLADDIARSVVFCAQQPDYVTISDMTVVPTIQADANHVFSEGKLSAMFD